MTADKNVDDFLSQYDGQVFTNAHKLRNILFKNLPDIIEQIDISSGMIAYCYGQSYTEMICTIIPSKKGLKLGFAYGVDFPDPDNLLKGTGKISRYVEIKTDKLIGSPAIKKLLANAMTAYKKRMTTKKM